MPKKKATGRTNARSTPSNPGYEHIANPYGRKSSDYKTRRAYLEQLALDNGYTKVVKRGPRKGQVSGDYEALIKHRADTGKKNTKNIGRGQKRVTKAGNEVKVFSFTAKNKADAVMKYDKQEKALDKFIRSLPSNARIQFAAYANAYQGGWKWVSTMSIPVHTFLHNKRMGLKYDGQSSLDWLRSEFNITDDPGTRNPRGIGRVELFVTYR